MKLINLCGCLILLITTSYYSNDCFGQTQINSEIQEDSSVLEINSMLKELCSNYFKEISKEKPSIDKTYSILKEYCTANFIEQYKNPDSGLDSFLQKEMINEVLLDSIKVKKSNVLNEICYVSTIFNSSPITLKTRIVKEKAGYKLDYIFINEYNEISE